MPVATSAAPRQVLLRLPEDVAARLARAVAPRRRNQFLVDLVRRELDKEDRALVDACEAMNRLEAADPALASEAAEWLDATLAPSADALDAAFDARAFARDAAANRASVGVGVGAGGKHAARRR